MATTNTVAISVNTYARASELRQYGASERARQAVKCSRKLKPASVINTTATYSMTGEFQ